MWKIENERIDMTNPRANILERFFSNKLVQYNIGHVAYLSVVYRVFGFDALVFHLCYSFMCVLFLEMINYIEHYGLKRNKDEQGNYEPVSRKHSWNAPQRFSNYLLFKL